MSRPLGPFVSIKSRRMSLTAAGGISKCTAIPGRRCSGEDGSALLLTGQGGGFSVRVR